MKTVALMILALSLISFVVHGDNMNVNFYLHLTLCLGIPSLLVLLATETLVEKRATCPSCKKGFGYLTKGAFFVIPIAADIRFCPFCGLALDHEFDHNEKKDANKSALTTAQPPCVADTVPQKRRKTP